MNKSNEFAGTITGGLCWNELTKKRLREPLAIENFGYKVYSQNEEDGIIHELFRRIGTESKEFIEFGVQNGLECNSHYLLHQGWHGLWLEGNSGACAEISHRFKPVIQNDQLKVVNAFITRENIEELILKNRNSQTENTTPDFLSIDIDGNDWYVWDAIKAIKPRLVCIEYNGKFPPDYSWKQAYNTNHIWDSSDWQGASLKALEELGKEKGYVLVGTNLTGVNAFFVREDLFSEEKFSTSTTAEELYNPYRKDLHFETPGHDSKYCLIGQEENKGVLNYFDSVKDYKLFRKKERKNKFIKKLKKRIVKKYFGGKL